MHYGYLFTKEALNTKAPTCEVVQCDRQDVSTQIVDADVVVPLMTELKADVLKKAKKLKLIIQYGAGVEGVDIPTATQLGIFVSNIPSKDTGNAASCAEMAIFLILSVLRKLHEMLDSIEKSRLGVPLGVMLQGKHVLVVGFGNIAKELILRLHPFGVKMSALRKNGHKWDTCGDELGKQSEALLCHKGTFAEEHLMALLPCIDIIVLTCSLDESNRHMVNSKFISMCKDGVYIVNVARGGLIDYKTALDGLHSGKIAGMGLDVQFWEPFDPKDSISQHDRVVLTPHVAGVTETSYRNMADIVSEETLRISEGKRPSIQLNTPVVCCSSGQ